MYIITYIYIQIPSVYFKAVSGEISLPEVLRFPSKMLYLRYNISPSKSLIPPIFLS